MLAVALIHSTIENTNSRRPIVSGMSHGSTANTVLQLFFCLPTLCYNTNTCKAMQGDTHHQRYLRHFRKHAKYQSVIFSCFYFDGCTLELNRQGSLWGHAAHISNKAVLRRHAKFFHRLQFFCDPKQSQL